MVANGGSLIVAEAGLDLGGGAEGAPERGLGVRGGVGGGWGGGWWWWWVGEGGLWKGTESFIDRDGGFFL